MFNLIPLCSFLFSLSFFLSCFSFFIFINFYFFLHKLRCLCPDYHSCLHVPRCGVVDNHCRMKRFNIWCGLCCWWLCLDFVQADFPVSHFHGWEWKILVLLKNKKILSRGPLSWRNSMFASCVFKRRWRVFKRTWRIGGRKCRKMPESDICVCRKAKVVELHIVCVYVEIEFKKKKKNFDFESLVLRKFRKITAISHPCISENCHRIHTNQRK